MEISHDLGKSRSVLISVMNILIRQEREQELTRQLLWLLWLLLLFLRRRGRLLLLG